MKGLTVLIIIIIIIIIYGITIYNRFVHIHNKIEEALSGIDVALARRYATLTNLVEVVKGYVKHEEEVLTKIVQLRTHPTMKEREQADANYTQATHELFALKESYPELKANEQFLSLQRAIVDIEEHLAASRRMYNSNVSQYNDLLLSFPSSLIGQWIHAQKEDYFQANEEEKENIQVQL